jgi:hypothetical protein
MNEEIFKRLQDQCWIYPTHPDMIDTDSSSEVCPCGFDTKKFFKLIITKCIEEAGDPADGLIKGDTWHDGVRASVWSIRQYFGVEE